MVEILPTDGQAEIWIDTRKLPTQNVLLGLLQLLNRKTYYHRDDFGYVPTFANLREVVGVNENKEEIIVEVTKEGEDLTDYLFGLLSEDLDKDRKRHYTLRGYLTWRYSLPFGGEDVLRYEGDVTIDTKERRILIDPNLNEYGWLMHRISDQFPGWYVKADLKEESKQAPEIVNQ